MAPRLLPGRPASPSLQHWRPFLTLCPIEKPRRQSSHIVSPIPNGKDALGSLLRLLFPLPGCNPSPQNTFFSRLPGKLKVPRAHRPRPSLSASLAPAHSATELDVGAPHMGKRREPNASKVWKSFQRAGEGRQGMLTGRMGRITC